MRLPFLLASLYRQQFLIKALEQIGRSVPGPARRLSTVSPPQPITVPQRSISDIYSTSCLRAPVDAMSLASTPESRGSTMAGDCRHGCEYNTLVHAPEVRLSRLRPRSSLRPVSQ